MGAKKGGKRNIFCKNFLCTYVKQSSFLGKLSAAARHFHLLTMMLILDGNSEIGARAWSEKGYKVCLRHLFQLTVFANFLSFSKMTSFPAHLRNVL